MQSPDLSRLAPRRVAPFFVVVFACAIAAACASAGSGSSGGGGGSPDGGSGSGSGGHGSSNGGSGSGSGGASSSGGSTCGAFQQSCCPDGSCRSSNLTCTKGTCTQQRSSETGKPCNANGDCLSGICVPVGNGQSVCTSPCSLQGDCLSGWTCGAEGGQMGDVCKCTYAPESCNGRDDDCDGIVDDEPAVDTACAAHLGSGAVCNQGSCSCASGATLCNGRCADTSSDVNDCGSCGNRCSAPANATASCNGGSCSFSCDAGRTSCGGACVDTMSDPNNCGQCGNACPAVANGSPACKGGQCGYACSQGYVDNGTQCVMDPCVNMSDGATCTQVFFPRGICVSNKCVNPLANCEYETYGSNWMPGTPDVRWNLTVDNGATNCSCNGNTLTDGVQSMACSQCMFVGTYDYMGGAQNPDGITDQMWGCF